MYSIFMIQQGKREEDYDCALQNLFSLRELKKTNVIQDELNRFIRLGIVEIFLLFKQFIR